MTVGRALVGAFLFTLPAASGARAEHPDISWLNYTGAGSCASPCHVSGSWTMEAKAREFTHSAHFQLQASVPAQTIFDRAGDDVQGTHGMLGRICSLSGTLASIDWLGVRQADNPATPQGLPGGCARCHASNGTVGPDQLDEEHWQSVDCLICHALNYRVGGTELVNAADRLPIADAASPTGFRLPLPAGADLGASSLSISLHPTTQVCQRCHAGADAGFLQRTGAFNQTDDRHASTLSCYVCHQSQGHQFAAGRPKPTQWAVERSGTADGNQVPCAGCHSLAGQAHRPDLNMVVPAHPGFPGVHFQKLACETCHIPEIRGLSWQAFDRLERVVESGRFLQWRPQRGTRNDSPQPPDYLWYNGTVWTDDQPRGSLPDWLSRVTPFRRVVSRMPQDLASGRLLPLDLTVIENADSLMSNFVSLPEDTLALLDLAVRRGVAAAAAQDPAAWGMLVDGQGAYTGSWQVLDRLMYFPVNHGVKPVSQQPLTCTDCHMTGTRMDWQALGFPGDPYYLGAVGGGPRPGEFWLGPCRPNPFNNSTLVPFQLAQPGPVDLTVYDLQGRVALRVIHGEVMSAGRHEAQIAGDRLPSGVYLYRLRAQGLERSGKMLLVK